MSTSTPVITKARLRNLWCWICSQRRAENNIHIQQKL